MENQKKCTCPLCQKGDYNSEDYFVDMSFLKKERPIGVSGLMRVKKRNETSDIIEQKRQQYPDNFLKKIRTTSVK